MFHQSKRELFQASKQIVERYNLSEMEFDLVLFLTPPRALREPITAFAARWNMGRNLVYAYAKTEKVLAARREMIKIYFQDWVPDVLLAMKNEAMAGNYNAARLFLEYVDDFKKEMANHPSERPKFFQKDVNIIINKLEQKFYGKGSRKDQPADKPE